MKFSLELLETAQSGQLFGGKVKVIIKKAGCHLTDY